VCPQGQLLRRSRAEYQAEKVEYRAEAATCNACPLKAQCTESQQGRQLHRSFHAHYLERVQSYHQTPAYQKAMRKRQIWVEPLFAEAKDWHGMRRFRLRLLWRVNCEALRIAAGQNLKRLLKKRGWGRCPFPTEALCVSFWGLLREMRILVLEQWSFLVLIGSAYSMVRTQCISVCG
jgi:Transposase DDE domain